MFNCKIYQDLGPAPGGATVSVTLLEKEFKSLKEISIELGLTYQQVADLSSRRKQKEYQKFKYYPKIVIQRIPKNRSIIVDECS